jgi:type II secretory pathway pseudopilin PulG
MRTHCGRTGFSLLELQVAFIIFGLALAGLFPLVIMQSKQLSKVESRFNSATTYYLVPSSDPWVRKLGASATIQTQDPGPKPPVLLIDNADAGYSETGTNWTTETRASAYNGTSRAHLLGTGANKATWLFTGLTPCWYDVRATWPAAVGHAINSPCAAASP